jgi:dolichyl-phosphate-mannose-protein mannosyltransferase
MNGRDNIAMNGGNRMPGQHVSQADTIVSPQSRVTCTVVLLLIVHSSLLAWSAYRHSPVDNEVAHLAAGFSHFDLGRFDLYRVNPPLIRTVAALPIAALSPRMTWRAYDLDPLVRAEVSTGQDFLHCNGARTFWLVTLARWACIPFSVLGGYVCYRWARDLYGAASGLTSLSLWLFCPYVLGHSSLIIPDSHAAALGVTAVYCFWRWLKQPHWKRALAAGFTLGLAELAKTTLLVLYPVLCLSWIIYHLPKSAADSKYRIWNLGSLFAIIGISVIVINIGYTFEGSFRRLGEYRFQSLLMTGTPSLEETSELGENRFHGTWCGRIPLPLPANYLQGVDAQKLDFDQKRWSYLRETWKVGGWPYYYLYALVVKIPLGTWLLFAMAIAVSVLRRGYSTDTRSEIALLLPAFLVLTVVSSHVGFGVHSRYVIPALPFVFVWISKVARAITLNHYITALVVAASLSSSISSSLSVYPHSIAYFNGLAGGPRQGHKHLLGSNLAWGQDLLYLQMWYDNRPEPVALRLAVSTANDPRVIGIDFTLPPMGPRPASREADARLCSEGPVPGWYGVDVNALHATPLSVVDGRGGWKNASTPYCSYAYLRKLRPVAIAGYSIYIYHITLDDANRVRRELGLPELPDDWEQEDLCAQS